jgi:anti-sigma-K factor RskA
MNIEHNRRLQEKLAAEYVLGTLRGGARRRFQIWLQSDAHLQQMVRDWEQRLMPMVEFAEASSPRESVWQSIATRIQTVQPSRLSLMSFFNSLDFWRSVSAMATIAVLVLAVVVQNRNDTTGLANNYVATLSDEQSQAVAVVSSDVKAKQIVLRFVKSPFQDLPKDKSLELWSIAKNGKIRSLGLLVADAKAGVLRISLPAEVEVDTPDLLAISLEPKGGSGNPEKPSGPILFKGNWLKLT